ncbi:hypothetical protein Ga0609869_000534 [Rhodovulum iodosum]|uniref:Uncharacterized protein n=1 Tax=Rhodovulum iodosum TaxID=68291 RepID=A0ABV3XPD1_9RHOB|nr:hypothetical protein [Rhodovulum robiginosum]
MRAMYLAFAATIVIGVVAHYALEQIGYSSQDRYSSDSVRLD